MMAMSFSLELLTICSAALKIISSGNHRLIYTEIGIKNCEHELMIKYPRIRRATAVSMMILGAILMFLAPKVWWGVLLFVLGAAVELIGIALERRSK
jgi:hypothetical protein